MKILLLFLLISIQIFARKLIFVQNLFRHAARYPIFAKKQDFTNQPKITKYLGQLTNQGKNMQYILGKILYKKYWKELFAGTSAQFQVDNRLIYVKSTNVNRTIESAQSQLAGLLENLRPLTLRQQNLQYSLPPFQYMSNYLALNNSQKIWNVFNDTPKYQTIPIHTTSGGNGVSSVNPYDQGDFYQILIELTVQNKINGFVKINNHKFFKRYIIILKLNRQFKNFLKLFLAKKFILETFMNMLITMKA